jgi:hypothetical protein
MPNGTLSEVGKRYFPPVRLVLNLAVLSRLGHLALLRGRQLRGIAYFAPIETLAKVPFTGGPRNIPLFLAVQLSVAALAQRFEAIPQIPVVLSVRHLLFLIGAELRCVALPRSDQAGLEIADTRCLCDLSAFLVAEPVHVAFTHVIHAVLQVSIAVSTRNLVLLFGIQFFSIAIGKSLETILKIAILIGESHLLQFLYTQG